MNKICIVGSGAVGSTIALSAFFGGCSVKPFARKEDIRELIKPFPLRFKAFEIGSPVDECDYVIISVKSYDTESIASLINNGLLNGSVFIVAQNGIGGLETIKDVVKKRGIVAAAVINFGAVRRGPLVDLRGEGPVYIGCEGIDCSWALEPLARCLRLGGLKVILVDDITLIRRMKVAVNAIVNSLTTILNVKNGYLLADKDLEELVKVLAYEASRVLNLNIDDVLNNVKYILNSTSDNLSSMLQDLRSCRPLELSSILGPLAKTSPTYFVLYKLLRALRRRVCYSF